MKLLPLYMHITYIRFFFGGWGGGGVGVGVGVGRVSRNCDNIYQFRHVCLSVCPFSDHMEQLGAHFSFLPSILHLRIFLKSIEKMFYS